MFAKLIFAGAFDAITMQVYCGYGATPSKTCYTGNTPYGGCSTGNAPKPPGCYYGLKPVST